MASAQLRGKDGPVWALIHVLVGRHRYDQDAAQLLGLLEVPDMPNVERVKDTVAVRDLSVAAAQCGQDFSELLERLDLVPD